jgi:hypothetical protein
MAHTKTLSWHIPAEVSIYFEMASLAYFYLAVLVLLVGLVKALKAFAVRRSGSCRCRNARSKR